MYLNKRGLSLNKGLLWQLFYLLLNDSLRNFCRFLICIQWKLRHTFYKSNATIRRKVNQSKDVQILKRGGSMHGPFGIEVYIKNSVNKSDEVYEQGVKEIHPFLKSLPGFVSVTYYNLDELDYRIVISFSDESTTDQAVEILQNTLKDINPDAKVSKAEVVLGEFVDQVLAGKIQR
jgi:hypothetical protein